MPDDVSTWINSRGPAFLRKIGISKGDYVLDFGCNEGHYTLPLARIVGPAGVVYAMDKDAYALENLKERAKKLDLNNIKIIKNDGGISLPLRDSSIDEVLTFDMLHYLTNEERKSLYPEIFRVLKERGKYYVYPKHNKNDWPMWSLSEKTVEDIIAEIEDYGGFQFRRKIRAHLLHDDWFEWGDVLIFIKKI